MKKTLSFLLVLLSGLAQAQGKPTLIDAPLDVKAPVSDAVLDTMQSSFRLQLLRAGGVLLPTTSNWKSAVAALKRQDCDVRDECLRQLATTGGTLYALYASVERNAAGTLISATGRVVNQDGVQSRAPVTVQVKKKGSFEDSAKDALGQLIAKLELGTLPPVLTPAPKPVVEALPPPPPMVLVPPPPPPPAVVMVAPPPTKSGSGLKVAGFVTGGLAVVSAGFAAGFGISAAVTRGTLPPDGRLVDDAQVRAQQSVNTGATVALVTGAAAAVLAVTSITLLSLAPSETTSVTFAPTPSGAALVVGGRF